MQKANLLTLLFSIRFLDQESNLWVIWQMGTYVTEWWNEPGTAVILAHFLDTFIYAAV